MGYAVKELFYTLQGEGSHSGRAAVFCRFAGCNLWTGRESDRARAECRFCDTDFIGVDGPGGGKFTSAEALADAILACWNHGAMSHPERRFVVLTGGEPCSRSTPPCAAACTLAAFTLLSKPTAPSRFLRPHRGPHRLGVPVSQSGHHPRPPRGR